MWLDVELLDSLLTLGGVVVWGAVLAACVGRRQYLRLVPSPSPDRVTIDIHHVLTVVFIFLFALSAVARLLQPIVFAQVDKYNDLVRATIADAAAKTLMLTVMLILIVRSRALAGLFPSEPVRHDSPTAPWWKCARVIIISMLAYLAIYPLVNRLLVDIGVNVFYRLFHTLPTEHQALILLNDRQLVPLLKILVLVSAIVISPLAEELFFRGLLQNVLLRYLRRPTPAIVFSAAAFMSLHIPYYHQWPALLMLGAIFGWLYYRCRTVWVPIVTHVIFNSVTFLFWFLSR